MKPSLSHKTNECFRKFLCTQRSKLFLLNFLSLSIIWIFKSSLNVTIETATYSCPWEKNGLGRIKPTLDNENFLRRILNENFPSDGITNILEIKTILPTLLPIIVLAWITGFANCVTCNLVPLHKQPLV